MSNNSFERHRSDLCAQVSAHLTHALNTAASLNEFLERALPPLAHLFGTSRTMLIDYHENTHHFDLLHFGGFAESSRFELQQRLRTLELSRALSQKEPFFDATPPGFLYIPLYFTDTLEALLVLESPDAPQLNAENREVLLTVSKFLGLV